MWDALVVEPIPELGAVPGDILVVRDHEVLVAKTYGAGALDHLLNHPGAYRRLPHAWDLTCQRSCGYRLPSQQLPVLRVME